jgi:ATP-binding cassette subfamily C protein
MWSLVSELPGDIHASMGEQANSLSGGQLQRLGMARALYSKPRLLVLDEATSALDAGSEAEVSANINALGDSVTVLVIAHRLSTIQHADRVYAVDGGRIIGEGTFRQVRRSVPMIDEYVKLMSFDD